MEIVTYLAWAFWIVLGLGLFLFCVKIIGNCFAVVFALVLSWILVPQQDRAQFFALMCNGMFNKKGKPNE